jgi:hypothetical protein
MSAASPTVWKDIVPNFDSLPSTMQIWIKTNLPSLIDAAMQATQENGDLSENGQVTSETTDESGSSSSTSVADQPHNFGISAAGHTYQLTGKNHYQATQGNSSYVVGSQKTEVLGAGSVIHNLQDSVMQIDGNKADRVSGNRYIQTVGIHAQQSTTTTESVEEDETTLIGGTSTKVVGLYETISIGSMTASSSNPNIIVSNEEVFGTENKMVWGNGFERIVGNHYAAIGPNVSLPVPESELQAGDPVPSMAATAKSSSAKTIYSEVSLDWTAISGMNPSLMAASVTNLILGQEASAPPVVWTELIGGSKSESVYGAETALVTGKSSETVLGGTDNFLSGSMSEVKLGMSSDTVIGLAMDTTIGLTMPFDTISMGQVLLSLDATLASMESTDFELSMASLKIFTTGAAAVADAAEAAEAASKTANAAEEAARAAEEARDAETAAKAAKDAETATKASETAVAEGKLVENTEKATQAAEEAGSAAKAAQDADKAAKSAWTFTKAGQAANAAKAAKAAQDATDAAENLIKATQAVEDAEKAVDVAKAAEEASKTGETALKATEATEAATQASENLAKATKAADEAAKASEKAEQTAKAAEAAVTKAENAEKAAELAKKVSLLDKFGDKGAAAFGLMTKGIDLKAAAEAAGLSADQAVLFAKFMKGAKLAGKVAFPAAKGGMDSTSSQALSKPASNDNDGSETDDANVLNKALDDNTSSGSDASSD